MSMDTSKVHAIDRLNELIAIAADGREGFLSAAQKIEDDILKNLFQNCSEERAAYVTQLQQEVIALNGKPKDSKGDTKGLLHRTWLNIKSSITGKNRNAILQECLNGEKSARDTYKKILEQDYITGSTRDLLNFQLAGIEKVRKEIKSLLHS